MFFDKSYGRKLVCAKSLNSSEAVTENNSQTILPKTTVNELDLARVVKKAVGKILSKQNA